MENVINIAQLRKVNSLANTLNQHGLAVNREDAANLARDINGGKDMDYLKGLRINEKQEMEIVHTSNGQQMVLNKNVQEQKSDFMTKQQVESILQKFCDLFSEEMSQLNAQIKGLEIKFNYLQEQMLEAASKPSQPQHNPQTTFNREPENNTSLGAEPQRHVQQQHAQQPSPSNDGNHKTGGYASNDVCIEKFFYYGTK